MNNNSYLKFYDFQKKEWEVEEIKGQRMKRIKNPKSKKYDLKKEYLIQWKGFQTPSWEPEENLLNCKDLLYEYLKKINTDPTNKGIITNKTNDKSLEEEKNNNQNITMDDFCGTDSNTKDTTEEKSKIKILEVLGVKFPNNKNEKIKYKVKYKFNGKREIKLIKNDNNIIHNNLLVNFYEKNFSMYHKGEYIGN